MTVRSSSQYCIQIFTLRGKTSVKRKLLFAASALHQGAESNLRGRHRRIKIYLWFAAAFFVVSLAQQHAFACTDQDDQNGNACLASPGCAPCSGALIGLDSQRLRPNNQIHIASLDSKTISVQSNRVGVTGVRLGLFLVMVVVSTVQWLDSRRHKTAIGQRQP
jgi:hypothetical protein